MKKFVLILVAFVFTQTLCYAIEANSSDSVKVEYQIYGNDTIYYETHYKYGETIFCGLKQYEENLFGKFQREYNQMEFGDLIDEFNSDDENRIAFCKSVVSKILEGYEKERCAKFLEVSENSNRKVKVIISVDVNGKVFDLDFMYAPDYAEFMTNEDIVRNTIILKEGEPFLFFTDYAKMGVKILPRMHIPIDKCFME